MADDEFSIVSIAPTSSKPEKRPKSELAPGGFARYACDLAAR
jgi:hypothetical protein